MAGTAISAVIVQIRGRVQGVWYPRLDGGEATQARLARLGAQSPATAASRRYSAGRQRRGRYDRGLPQRPPGRPGRSGRSDAGRAVRGCGLRYASVGGMAGWPSAFACPRRSRRERFRASAWPWWSWMASMIPAARPPAAGGLGSPSVAAQVARELAGRSWPMSPELKAWRAGLSGIRRQEDELPEFGGAAAEEPSSAATACRGSMPWSMPTMRSPPAIECRWAPTISIGEVAAGLPLSPGPATGSSRWAIRQPRRDPPEARRGRLRRHREMPMSPLELVPGRTLGDPPMNSACGADHPIQLPGNSGAGRGGGRRAMPPARRSLRRPRGLAYRRCSKFGSGGIGVASTAEMTAI